jgi:CDP-diacylglycerol--serine O-phosphatidyltransferase
MRLARFNISSGGDKRYFVGLPSPAAAAVPAATVFAYPYGLSGYPEALPVLVMVLLPAALMVSTIRFRSFKTIDLQSRRPYTVLIPIAAGIMLIATHPRLVLVVLAYTYLMSGFVGLAITRFRHRGGRIPADELPTAPSEPAPRDATRSGWPGSA